jgi:hypothetical protein
MELKFALIKFMDRHELCKRAIDIRMQQLMTMIIIINYLLYNNYFLRPEGSNFRNFVAVIIKKKNNLGKFVER